MVERWSDPRTGALAASLDATKAWLSDRFLADHARLFVPEHLLHLAGSLLELHTRGIPATRPAPHFSVECTPSFASAWELFRQPIAVWVSASAGDDLDPRRILADAMQRAGIDAVLLLMGQRRTPASVTDARAIPPTRAELWGAAEREHGAGLSVVARALTKHAARSAEAFWGEIRGSVSDKNRLARAVLERVLDAATWWNVFGHPAHGMAYELRVQSGHGARWSLPGPVFVGFLEPFVDQPEA